MKNFEILKNENGDKLLIDAYGGKNGRYEMTIKAVEKNGVIYYMGYEYPQNDIYKSHFEDVKNALNNQNISFVRENIKNLLEETKQKELTQYINKNIDNVEYLKNIEFLEYSAYLTRRETSAKTSGDVMGEIVTVDMFKSNIIQLESDRNIIYYDMVKNEITKAVKYSYSNNQYENTNILDLFCSGYDKNMLLFAEQMNKKSELIPEQIKEIQKLNDFLSGKKSLTIILRDGQELKAKCKYNDGFTFGVMFSRYNGKMELRDYACGLSFGYKDTKYINDVAGFKFSNKVFEMNAKIFDNI